METVKKFLSTSSMLCDTDIIKILNLSESNSNFCEYEGPDDAIKNYPHLEYRVVRVDYIVDSFIIYCKRANHVWKPSDDAYIYTNINKLTYKQMAEHIGCSVAAVKGRICKLRNHELSSYDRVSPKIRSILDDYRMNTYSDEQLAEKYNISLRKLTSILDNHIWSKEGKG